MTMDTKNAGSNRKELRRFGIIMAVAFGVIGGLFHMINNAIYKSNLFLMSGTVGRATGSDELEDMGGLARHLPVTFGRSRRFEEVTFSL